MPKASCVFTRHSFNLRPRLHVFKTCSLNLYQGLHVFSTIQFETYNQDILHSKQYAQGFIHSKRYSLNTYVQCFILLKWHSLEPTYKVSYIASDAVWVMNILYHGISLVSESYNLGYLFLAFLGYGTLGYGCVLSLLRTCSWDGLLIT